MSDFYRPISRCSDRTLLGFYNRLQKEMNFGTASLKIFSSSENVELNAGDDLGIIFEGSVGYSIEAVSSVRQATPSGSQAFTVIFGRGLASQNPANGYWYTQSSLTIDHLRFNPSSLKFDDANLFNRIVQDELVAKTVPISAEVEGNSLRDLVTTHHQLIAALNEQIVSVGGKFAEARIKLEGEMEERKRRIEEEATAQSERLQALHTSQLAILSEERAALDERARELDDRDNTHVRREIRKQLKEQLASYKETFELTKGTKKLRQPIIWTVGIIEAVCLLLIIYSFGFYPSETSDLWSRILFWLKNFALSAFAVGTAVWFLKWLTQWSNRHADAEFQLKQLELDMDRASWVVETAFEWKSSQESTIPEPLLAAMSRNLFDGSSQKTENDDSPLDHLASALLGEASRARIKLAGGHEVDYERKALKKAGKEG